MASEAVGAESSCVNDPNFAVICSFLDKFGEACGVPYPSFSDLQAMLENAQEVVPLPLIDLHVRLLRKVKKSVSMERWEKAVVKFVHTYSNLDGWELERVGYKKAKLPLKLRLLKNLLERQFDFNARFKSLINKQSAESLRLKPLGRDKLGQSYWYQVDAACNLRVYREDQDDETWDLVARDRETLIHLIEQLSSSEPGRRNSDTLDNEDSNSQDMIEKPLIDTGQVSDEGGGDDEDEEDEEEEEDEEKEAGQEDKAVEEGGKAAEGVKEAKSEDAVNIPVDKQESKTPVVEQTPEREGKKAKLEEAPVLPPKEEPVKKAEVKSETKSEEPRVEGRDVSQLVVSENVDKPRSESSAPSEKPRLAATTKVEKPHVEAVKEKSKLEEASGQPNIEGVNDPARLVILSTSDRPRSETLPISDTPKQEAKTVSDSLVLGTSRDAAEQQPPKPISPEEKLLKRPKQAKSPLGKMDAIIERIRGHNPPVHPPEKGDSEDKDKMVPEPTEQSHKSPVKPPDKPKRDMPEQTMALDLSVPHHSGAPIPITRHPPELHPVASAGRHDIHGTVQRLMDAKAQSAKRDGEFGTPPKKAKWAPESRIPKSSVPTGSLVGEAIEEPVIVVRGEGSGADCEGGNTGKEEEQKRVVVTNPTQGINGGGDSGDDGGVSQAEESVSSIMEGADTAGSGHVSVSVIKSTNSIGVSSSSETGVDDEVGSSVASTSGANVPVSSSSDAGHHSVSSSLPAPPPPPEEEDNSEEAQFTDVSSSEEVRKAEVEDPPENYDETPESRMDGQPETSTRQEVVQEDPQECNVSAGQGDGATNPPEEVGTADSCADKAAQNKDDLDSTEVEPPPVGEAPVASGPEADSTKTKEEVDGPADEGSEAADSSSVPSPKVESENPKTVVEPDQSSNAGKVLDEDNPEVQPSVPTAPESAADRAPVDSDLVESESATDTRPPADSDLVEPESATNTRAPADSDLVEPESATDTRPPADSDLVEPESATDTRPPADSDLVEPESATDTRAPADSDLVEPESATNTRAPADSDLVEPESATNTTPPVDSDLVEPESATNTIPPVDSDLVEPESATDTNPPVDSVPSPPQEPVEDMVPKPSQEEPIADVDPAPSKDGAVVDPLPKPPEEKTEIEIAPVLPKTPPAEVPSPSKEEMPVNPLPSPTKELLTNQASSEISASDTGPLVVERSNSPNDSKSETPVGGVDDKAAVLGEKKSDDDEVAKDSKEDVHVAEQGPKEQMIQKEDCQTSSAAESEASGMKEKQVQEGSQVEVKEEAQKEDSLAAEEKAIEEKDISEEHALETKGDIRVQEDNKKVKETRLQGESKSAEHEVKDTVTEKKAEDEYAAPEHQDVEEAMAALYGDSEPCSGDVNSESKADFSSAAAPSVMAEVSAKSELSGKPEKVPVVESAIFEGTSSRIAEVGKVPDLANEISKEKTLEADKPKVDTDNEPPTRAGVVINEVPVKEMLSVEEIPINEGESLEKTPIKEVKSVIETSGKVLDVDKSLAKENEVDKNSEPEVKKLPQPPAKQEEKAGVTGTIPQVHSESEQKLGETASLEKKQMDVIPSKATDNVEKTSVKDAEKIHKAPSKELERVDESSVKVAEKVQTISMVQETINEISETEGKKVMVEAPMKALLKGYKISEEEEEKDRGKIPEKGESTGKCLGMKVKSMDKGLMEVVKTKLDKTADDEIKKSKQEVGEVRKSLVNEVENVSQNLPNEKPSTEKPLEPEEKAYEADAKTSKQGLPADQQQGPEDVTKKEDNPLPEKKVMAEIAEVIGETRTALASAQEELKLVGLEGVVKVEFSSSSAAPAFSLLPNEDEVIAASKSGLGINAFKMDEPLDIVPRAGRRRSRRDTLEGEPPPKRVTRQSVDQPEEDSKAEEEEQEEEEEEEAEVETQRSPARRGRRGRRGRGGWRGRGRGRGRGWRKSGVPRKDAEPTGEEGAEESGDVEVTPAVVASSGRRRGRGRGGKREVVAPSSPVPVVEEEQPSSPPPMRQSRRIALIRQKEEEERRKTEEEHFRMLKEEAVASALNKKKKKRKDGDDGVEYIEEEEEEEEEEEDDNDDDDEVMSKKRRKKRRRRKKKHGVDENEVAADGVIKKKRKKKKKNGKRKKKRPKGNNPWESSGSSSSSEEVEEEEEEYQEEEDDGGDLVFKSDHEFSPESDLGEDEEWQPTKRARTAKKEVAEAEGEADKDEKPCQKCGQLDHPEWILLCDTCDTGWHASCLRPALMVVPEGDWFCPPCEHTKLLDCLQENLRELDRMRKRKDNQEMRRKRLAYVGISLDNILPQQDRLERGEGEEEDEEGEMPEDVGDDRRRRMDEDDDDDDDDESSDGSESESESGSTDDSEEPIYQLRARRQNQNFSYRFQEFDELIDSAIQEELDDVKGAGNMGKGKDIENIVNAEREEKRMAIAGEEGELQSGEAMEGEDQVALPLTVEEKETKEGESQPVEEGAEPEQELPAETGDGDMVVAEEEGGGGEDEEEEDDFARKVVKRKRGRKLTQLDVSSGNDTESDEDFKGTSSDEEEEELDDDEDFSPDESEEEDLGIKRKGKRRAAAVPVRRSTRASKSRFRSDDFEDSDESDEPQTKRRKRPWASGSESELSDETWGKKKKKKRTTFGWPRKPSSSGRKKKSRIASDSDEAEGKSKRKRKKGGGGRRIKYGLDDERPTRRTRGCKVNYRETEDSNDSDENAWKKKQQEKESEDEYNANEDEDQEEEDKEDVDDDEEDDQGWGTKKQAESKPMKRVIAPVDEDDDEVGEEVGAVDAPDAPDAPSEAVDEGADDDELDDLDEDLLLGDMIDEDPKPEKSPPPQKDEEKPPVVVPPPRGSPLAYSPNIGVPPASTSPAPAAAPAPAPGPSYHAAPRPPIPPARYPNIPPMAAQYRSAPPPYTTHPPPYPVRMPIPPHLNPGRTGSPPVFHSRPPSSPYSHVGSPSGGRLLVNSPQGSPHRGPSPSQSPTSNTPTTTPPPHHSPTSRPEAVPHRNYPPPYAYSPYPNYHPPPPHPPPPAPPQQYQRYVEDDEEEPHPGLAPLRKGDDEHEGEFGGLVSYFSSQQQDDLDS